MENKDLAKYLLKLCGGKTNVAMAENCMTRLRVVLKDKDKADFKKIKNCEDVLGFVGEDKDIQIVIGPGKVAKVTNYFNDLVGDVDATSKDSKIDKNKSEKSGIKRALKMLSQIFIPLIPGIMGCGLILALATILNVLISQQVIPDTTLMKTITTLLSLLGNAVMSFLCIFVGVNAAKVFKCSTILGGLVGGIVLLAGINDLAMLLNQLSIEWFNIKDVIYNEKTPDNSILTTGKGGIIGVIVGVWVLSKIENWLHKKIPDSLDLIIVPLVTILITGTLMILIIMPLTGFIATGIIWVFDWLGNSSSLIVQGIFGFILGATFLPMVMMGMHQALTPIYLLQLDQIGHITIIGSLMMSGGANVGAAIAIYFKAKSVGHTSLQRIIKGSIPSAILGIHEPLIYGMTLPIMISFVPIGIGGGLGGAYCMLTSVFALSFGPSTLLGVTTMEPSSMINYLVGLVISCVSAIIATWFIVSKDRIKQHMDSVNEGLSSGADFNELVKS